MIRLVYPHQLGPKEVFEVSISHVRIAIRMVLSRLAPPNVGSIW